MGNVFGHTDSDTGESGRKRKREENEEQQPEAEHADVLNTPKRLVLLF